MAEKIVVLLAHPDMEKSVANKALMAEVKEMGHVTYVNLYDQKDECFDVEAYKTLLSEAKALVLQFPFYWASAPYLLKKWTDDVFTNFAQSPVIQDKPLLVVTTTASEYDAYRSGGRNRFTMDELLRPYQLMATHAGMVWQTPIVVYGLASEDAEENLEFGREEFKEKLIELGA